MKRSLLLILVLLPAAAFFTGRVSGVQYISKKAFVKKHIASGSKLSKSTIQLSEEKKKSLVEKWNWDGTVSKMSFIIGRDQAGAVTGVIYFTTLYATEHKCVHHLGVALAPDGTVKEAVVTELFCERAMPVTTKSFLGQFAGKSAKKLKLNDDINNVTGATESAKTILESVNTAIAGYAEFVNKQK